MAQDFWARICDALFIKSPDWFETVRSLPDKLDLSVCLRRTCSGEGVTSTYIQARGWIGRGIVEEVRPNPLRPDDNPFTPRQWVYLQFMLQFFQFEGMYNYLLDEGYKTPEEWHPSVVEDLLELAQTMTFYSAMLLLCEEGCLPEDETKIEAPIRDEVRKIVDVLIAKTGDYGQAFLRHGVPGLMHRTWDKLARYATLSAEDRPAKYESRIDTVRDMLGYSCLLWSILEGMR